MIGFPMDDLFLGVFGVQWTHRKTMENPDIHSTQKVKSKQLKIPLLAA